MSVEDSGDAPKARNVEIHVKQGQHTTADRKAENIGSLAAAGAAAGAVIAIAVSSSTGILAPVIGAAIGTAGGGGVGYVVDLFVKKRRGASEES